MSQLRHILDQKKKAEKPTATANLRVRVSVLQRLSQRVLGIHSVTPVSFTVKLSQRW